MPIHRYNPYQTYIRQKTKTNERYPITWKFDLDDEDKDDELLWRDKEEFEEALNRIRRMLNVMSIPSTQELVYSLSSDPEPPPQDHPDILTFLEES